MMMSQSSRTVKGVKAMVWVILLSTTILCLFVSAGIFRYTIPVALKIVDKSSSDFSYKTFLKNKPYYARVKTDTSVRSSDQKPEEKPSLLGTVDVRNLIRKGKHAPSTAQTNRKVKSSISVKSRGTNAIANTVKNMNVTQEFDLKTVMANLLNYKHNSPPRSIVTHIGFLKVHKTGSTMLENMFDRFALKHNLNIALPMNGNYLKEKSNLMNTTKFSDHFDIFASHSVYSKQLFDYLLEPDAVKIGIIREPFDRMVSAAYYYRDVFHVRYLTKVPKTNFIHNLVKYPEKYELKQFSNTRNSMALDFGFPKDISINDTIKVNRYLKLLDKEFQLVMVTEKLDESLVLMRRLLNWSIGDIIHLTINAQPNKHNPVILQPSELEIFKRTSFLDYALYDHFLKIFQDKLQAAGKDLENEVQFYRKCLSAVREFCKKETQYDYIEFEQSDWDESFKITKEECFFMSKHEPEFLPILKKMYGG